MKKKRYLLVILFLTFSAFWNWSLESKVFLKSNTCQALLGHWIKTTNSPEEYTKVQKDYFWNNYHRPNPPQWREILDRWRKLRRDFYMWLNENPRPALYYANDSPCFPKIILYVDALRDGQLENEAMRSVRLDIEGQIKDFQNYRQQLDEMLDELNAATFHYRALAKIKTQAPLFPFSINYSIPIKGVLRPFRDEVDNMQEFNDHLWQLKKRIKTFAGGPFSREVGAISERMRLQALLAKRLKYLRAAMRDTFLNFENLPSDFHRQYQQVDKLLNDSPMLQPHYSANSVLLKKELTVEFQELSRLKTQWYKEVVDPNVQKILALLSEEQKERMGLDKFGHYKNILQMTKYSFLVTKVTPLLAGTPLSFWALHDLIRLFNWESDQKGKCVRTTTESFEKCVANYIQAQHLELLTTDSAKLDQGILQEIAEMVLARTRFLEEKKKEGQLERDLMEAVREATKSGHLGKQFPLTDVSHDVSHNDILPKTLPKKSFLFWHW